MNYKVHSKINWEIIVKADWKEAFYPSLVKKLEKSEEYFERNIDFKLLPLNRIEEASNFFNLYDREIVSRKNYAYGANEQKLAYEKRLNLRQYYQAIITNKNGGGYVGGMIFSIFDHKLSFGLRSFDKNLRKELQKETTVDYWAEKKIHELAKSKNLNIISHGTETYPNKGRTGLVLFKLKIGGKPKLSRKEYEILNLSEGDVQNFDSPTFFWTNPDEKEYFKKAHIFYKNEAIKEDVLSELTKVTAWAGTELVLHNL